MKKSISRGYTGIRLLSSLVYIYIGKCAGCAVEGIYLRRRACSETDFSSGQTPSMTCTCLTRAFCRVMRRDLEQEARVCLGYWAFTSEYEFA